MNRNQIDILAMIIITVMLGSVALATYYGSQREINFLAKQNKLIRDDYSEEVTKYVILELQYDELLENFNTLNETYTDLLERHQNLTRDYDILVLLDLERSRDIAILYEQIDFLSLELIFLQDEYNYLYEQYESLEECKGC